MVLCDGRQSTSLHVATIPFPRTALRYSLSSPVHPRYTTTCWNQRKHPLTRPAPHLTPLSRQFVTWTFHPLFPFHDHFPGDVPACLGASLHVGLFCVTTSILLSSPTLHTHPRRSRHTFIPTGNFECFQFLLPLCKVLVQGCDTNVC